MKSRDGLIANDGSDNPPFCFAKEGEVYVIYRVKGDDIKLNLSDHPGEYFVKWYDPRKGGELQDGPWKKSHLQNLSVTAYCHRPVVCWVSK
jgi:hypothetical protein